MRPAGKPAQDIVTGIAFLCSIVGNGLWKLASRALPLTLVGHMIVFETMFAALYRCLWEGAGRRCSRPRPWCCWWRGHFHFPNDIGKHASANPARVHVSNEVSIRAVRALKTTGFTAWVDSGSMSAGAYVKQRT